ncbi:V-type ATP synthase subunit E [Haloimpatiens massiliensis]|uniref:V-type ATP synthase subunit E n=1 Tax=Haloimpatiens massiliensis TaxID=1658110 RepID=UPI000C8199D6|nr:V-type ATP synthase subunit E family protein [Haloimpatiens massiliensis]
MTSIDDKIKLFTKLTYDKIQAEKGIELEKIQNMKEKMISDEKEKIKKIEDLEMKEALKKAELKANEIIAKAKSQNHQEILNLKEDLIGKVYKDVMNKLIKFTDKEEYKDLLIKIIKVTFEECEEGEYRMYLTTKDYNKYHKDIEGLLKEFKNIKVTVEKTREDIIGGIVIEDSKNKMRIDNSLGVRLKDNIWDMGLKVTENINFKE